MVYPKRIKGAILAKQNGRNAAYFNAQTQTYSVYRDGKRIVDGKYSFKEIEPYIV